MGLFRLPKGSDAPKQCDFCREEITYTEECHNGGICDACYRDATTQKETKVVRGCENYEKCKNEANIYMGNGKLCDVCRLQRHEDIKNSSTKVVPIASVVQPVQNLSKFINGLERAMNVK